MHNETIRSFDVICCTEYSNVNFSCYLYIGHFDDFLKGRNFVLVIVVRHRFNTVHSSSISSINFYLYFIKMGSPSLIHVFFLFFYRIIKLYGAANLKKDFSLCVFCLFVFFPFVNGSLRFHVYRMCRAISSSQKHINRYHLVTFSLSF